MSNHLRDDKQCENCGHTVEQIYCPRCGQKNTETRQSFAHLAAHVAEDITHYDSGFWRTVKYLMLRPGRLTIEYLAGKRQRYVPPVKLYIFISFITFFLLAISPVFTISDDNKKEAAKAIDPDKPLAHTGSVSFGTESYDSIEQLDSVQNSLPEDKKMGYTEYTLKKKMITVLTKIPASELGEQFIASAQRNMPKVLFIYMPVFAFWLWLFHGKKRWYFFDHGIFTLHYFSFLLLLSSICLTLITVLALITGESPVYDILNTIITTLSVLYSIIYFFIAHKKMYGERKFISIVKSFFLSIINFFCIFVTLVVTIFIIFITLH